jgi:hypothetical protein
VTELAYATAVSYFTALTALAEAGQFVPSSRQTSFPFTVALVPLTAREPTEAEPLVPEPTVRGPGETVKPLALPTLNPVIIETGTSLLVVFLPLI